MRYLILGKDGQLAKAFQKRLQDNDLLALSKQECNIAHLDSVLEMFEEYKPDIVLNCAAYNLVDRAETEYWDAYNVNALGVKNLAIAAKRYDSHFITYSTDYVFDGSKEDGLYTEEDMPNPLNEYGKSKLTGEKWIEEESLEKYLVFRTSWVYGEGKQNFIYKLMQWAQKSEYLKIAYDEISVPTSTRTIVDVTLKAIEKGVVGLYHLTNSGYASRYEWAKKILEMKGIKKFIYPVSKDIFNLPAQRAKFSAMSNEKIAKELEMEIASWEEELGRSMYE